MNLLKGVVADTTPLNYLILIRQSEILATLFDQVMIPQAVLNELRHPKAPEAVSHWLRSLPSWLVVTTVQKIDETIMLGQGENEAISLAIERHVPVVLMDERRDLRQTTFRADSELLDRFESKIKSRRNGFTIK